MRRMVDLRCEGCETERIDQFLAEDDKVTCPTCGMLMEQVWWKRLRHSDAQWSDRDDVVVHRDPRTGEIRYPARTDAPVKQGFERVYLRSLSEVTKFEREHNVVNHVMHYDRNGRDYADPISRPD